MQGGGEYVLRIFPHICAYFEILEKCAYLRIFLDFWGNARIFFLGAGENFACLGKTSEIRRNLVWVQKVFLENPNPCAKVCPKCSVLSEDSKNMVFIAFWGRYPQAPLGVEKFRP